jgi:hypothetical protein
MCDPAESKKHLSSFARSIVDVDIASEDIARITDGPHKAAVTENLDQSRKTNSVDPTR